LYSAKATSRYSPPRLRAQGERIQADPAVRDPASRRPATASCRDSLPLPGGSLRPRAVAADPRSLAAQGSRRRPQRHTEFEAESA
jgi:hypothetical protein